MLKDSISTSRVEGDHSNGYLARRFDHALFFVQNPASRYIAEGCSQVLADANAMFDKPRFSWEICSDLEALAGGSHTGAARLALFFIGGTQARWRLYGKEASAVKLGLHQASHVGVVGAGAFIPIEIGIPAHPTLSIHETFVHAVEEAFFTPTIANQFVSHDRWLSSATGAVAAMQMMVDIVAQQAGPTVSLAVSERLGFQTTAAKSRSVAFWKLVSESRCDPLIERAMNVMDANLENRVATACIAEALHISVRQLERRFNDALGVSPKKVYTILRLERAHQLLLQTLLSPHEIAVACGFPSMPNFTKRYREMFGESPAGMRKRVLAKNFMSHSAAITKD